MTMTGSNGRTERQKMLAGDHYRVDAELAAEQLRAERLLRAYNATTAADVEQRAALLSALLGAIGEDSVIRPPFHCDYGTNIRIGRGCFVNFGCVFLDVAAIALGDACQIGPLVQILTADHPRDAAQRRDGYESGKPITIGANVWIGGGAILLPGIRIGEDAIIGAGSVVTRDVPAGATVSGNPARAAKKEG
ncbi:MAG: Maltose O-acetyltransferase [Rhodospirillales bacterium]|jgi:maltose O-acetyltransferase|nr:Maltose O-acetyltransferase [Rhodospirillales bacterium]